MHSPRPGASGSRVAPGHYDNAAGSYALRDRDRRGSIAVAAPPDPALARASGAVRAWCSPKDHRTVAEQRLRNTGPCEEGRSNPRAQSPIGGGHRRAGSRLESGARCLLSRHRSAARLGPAPWAARPLFARAADPVRRARRRRCRDSRRVAGSFHPLRIERAARAGAGSGGAATGNAALRSRCRTSYEHGSIVIVPRSDLAPARARGAKVQIPRFDRDRPASAPAN